MHSGFRPLAAERTLPAPGMTRHAPTHVWNPQVWTRRFLASVGFPRRRDGIVSQR